ncbi:PilZ domain-containing protein [Desulfuromonas sp.]|uniref:PilZ domain-containing protein n=1 Tax=Desulfuromonas sp. TaxID=892 RepID=UPI0025BABDD0|nr:PilZ domain-containing protein [Desulfuromonas sp.]
MQFSKYFKPNQTVYLRTLTPEPVPEGLEAFTAHLVELRSDCFVLALPYPRGSDASPPCLPGQDLELCSETFGLGLRVTGRYLGSEDNGQIRIAPHQNLELFQKREYPRADLTVGLAILRKGWPLTVFQEKWEAFQGRLTSLADGSAPDLRPTLVNLSAGGVRMDLPMPIAPNDLTLLCLGLSSEEPPIAALAEVVRAMDPAPGGKQTAALRFIRILDADQARIDNFIRNHFRDQGQEVVAKPFRGQSYYHLP